MTDTTTTSFGLMLIAQQLLLDAGTAAGDRVYAPGDWPTWDGEYPYIRIRVSRDRKESLGRHAPQFTVTGTLSMDLVVAAQGLQDSTASDRADRAVWALQRQCEVGLINAYSLTLPLQQFSSIDTRDKYDSSGARHFGAIEMDVGAEFYQGVEDFCPIPTVDITGVTVAADLSNIFDPTGTYADPPFPASVTPAPRTAGPDGRSEGGLGFVAGDDGALQPGDPP